MHTHTYSIIIVIIIITVKMSAVIFLLVLVSQITLVARVLHCECIYIVNEIVRCIEGGDSSFTPEFSDNVYSNLYLSPFQYLMIVTMKPYFVKKN